MDAVGAQQNAKVLFALITASSVLFFSFRTHFLNVVDRGSNQPIQDDISDARWYNSILLLP